MENKSNFGGNMAKVKNYQIRFNSPEWEKRLEDAAGRKGLRAIDYIRMVVAEAIGRDAV